MVTNNNGAVAVIDDDPAVLDSLKFLLELAGHLVRTYASAGAFLDDCRADPACLILDHHMPMMTGLELAARLRDDGVAIPMLLITGSPSPAILARALALGVEKVLEKPPGADDLLDFVSMHGGRESGMATTEEDRERRIGARARFLWRAEGAPKGREAEYLERARELQAIDDNPTAGQLPNPMTLHHGEVPPAEPVEEAEIEENLGEFPGRLTDQGERIPTPMTRKKARRVLREE